MNTAKLPAGKYYIGDPCYVFNKSWDDVLEQTNYFENENLEIFGKKVVGGSTAHGDGTYDDNCLRSYPVDAGLIAILPVELLQIDNETTEEGVEENGFGHIVEFEDDFIATYKNGTYQFGHIYIDTDWAEEEEEDDWYEDEEDEDY